jgi:hypothetical protein
MRRNYVKVHQSVTKHRCRRVPAYQDCGGRDDEVGTRRTTTDAWVAERSSCWSRLSRPAERFDSRSSGVESSIVNMIVVDSRC